MRPVKLVMQGFGAYRDRTEVDFDGVELFALTGPTGAGKSTVVDAICMALYGSVPRYDNKTLIAPAISQGLNEAMVHLDFLVEGVPYTAVRVIRRSPSGGASTKEARLECKGEVLAGTGAEVTDRVVQLLGLSYEHFTRCVVLPQGQFAQFLHDRPKDRQELLKTLLDITVYERVASAARDRAREAKARANAASERLTELEPATPARRKELEARAAVLEALYDATRVEEAALHTLADDADAARATVTTLTATVAQIESVSIPPAVDKLASSLARNREEMQDASVDAIEAAMVFADYEQELIALGDVTELRLARQAHEQLDALAHATPERRAELVTRLTALVELHGELQADEADTAARAAAANATRQRATAASAAASTLEQLVVPPDVVELAESLAAITTQGSDAEEALLGANRVVTERQAALNALGSVADLTAARRSLERRVALVAQQLDVDTHRQRVQRSLDEARQAERTARSTHERARLALDQAQIAHQAHALRPHLVAGEPCPVCEQVVATLPPGALAESLASAQSAEAAAAQRVKQAESATANEANALQRIEIEAASLAAQIVDIDAALDTSQTIETIDAQLRAIAEGAEELSVAKAAQSMFEDRRAALRADEKRLRASENRARTVFLKAHAQVSALRPPIPTSEDVRADWEALVSWASDEAAVQAASAVSLARESEHTEIDVARRRDAARARCEELDVVVAPRQLASEATYGAARSCESEIARLDDALTAIEGLRSSLDDFASKHPTRDSSVAAIDAQLALVAKASSALEEARTQQRAVAQRIEELRTEHAALLDEEASGRHELSRALAELAGLGPPVPLGRDVRDDWYALAEWAETEAPIRATRATELADHGDKIDRERERRQKELVAQCELAGVHPQPGRPMSESMLAATTRAAEDVARIDDQITKVAELQASVTALIEEAVVADELARLLRADHFEKWLLDDVMTQLVEGATITLMELSGDQFSLAYDDGNFMVIDHKNADQQRQAKTLSGGETFLASLALALSLADQLASFATGKTVTLDALFLDEGFGSLDADTLDVVASAIEDLGSRGRMVGLISHVPELADRVPVRFEVRKIANASHIEKVLQ